MVWTSASRKESETTAFLPASSWVVICGTEIEGLKRKHVSIGGAVCAIMLLMVRNPTIPYFYATFSTPMVPSYTKTV